MLITLTLARKFGNTSRWSTIANGLSKLWHNGHRKALGNAGDMNHFFKANDIGIDDTTLYEKTHEHKTVFAAWLPLREMDRYITQTQTDAQNKTA